ncbi:MAG TPA: hypothetical protein VNO55_00725 [Polyangia bacterium]|nr:hypothetical protein [Polyangia bacterium]
MNARRARTRDRAFVLALALALAAALAGPARGQLAEPPSRQLPRRVTLDASACPDVPAAALRRIMVIEIGDLLVGADEQPAGDTDRVQLACAGRVARVSADGPGRPRALERRLPLDDFPGDAAPRALALAAVEILAALSPDVRARVEARQRPAAVVQTPPAVARAPGPATPPAPSARREWTLLGAASLQAFVSTPGLTTWGGRLAVRRSLGARLELTAGGDLAGGTVAGPLGVVSTKIASAAVLVGARVGGPRLEGGLALGGRTGMAWFEGQAGDPNAFVGSSASRPWGGPVAVARARLGVGRVGLEMATELGYAFGRADASSGDAIVASVGGPWLAVTAGLGWEL